MQHKISMVVLSGIVQLFTQTLMGKYIVLGRDPKYMVCKLKIFI